jgi:hypothetical protein
VSERQVQTRGIVPDLSARHDDQLFLGDRGEAAPIIVTDKIEAPGHVMPEEWLRSRVRGWMMHENQLPDGQVLAFWIGAYTADGQWIYCSSDADSWAPQGYRQEYARRVNAHLNRECAFGGAWLTGWVRGGREFYLLWKDKDGDLQIPMECDKPFIALGKWSVEDWERQAVTAWNAWREFHKNLELGKGQEKKVAQGERTSAGHMQGAPKVSL